MKAKSRLLEPYYRFRMELPNECVGRAMTDVMQMSGMAEPVENDGAITVLCGRAPVSGLMEYASVLMSYTHGKGKIEFVLDGYDYCHNESEVIEASGYDPESDTVNTADSVSVHMERDMWFRGMRRMLICMYRMRKQILIL